MNYDIFISYRREGGYDTAQHLYNLLSREHYRVSFDIDTLRNGDFDTSLLKRIDQCKDFILIVDPHAFDRTLDPTFDKKKDWLRQELAYALKKGKNIIPVFLAGVKGFPDNLPDDIKAVAKKNGPECIQGHFNMFYEDLKKRFFVTPAPRHTAIKISLGVIVVVALLCLGYVYRPYDTVSVPLSYSDDWEDDVHVDIPTMYSLDASSDIDDQTDIDVKFFHFSPNQEMATALVEEVYEDLDADDLGFETDEDFENYISLLKSANTKQFDTIYLQSLSVKVPGSQHKSTYDHEAEYIDWRVYVLSNNSYDYYYAVYRVPDSGNVIFSMILPKSSMPLTNWRNKHIFNSTLDRVAKAYIRSLADE